MEKSKRQGVEKRKDAHWTRRVKMVVVSVPLADTRASAVTQSLEEEEKKPLHDVITLLRADMCC